MSVYSIGPPSFGWIFSSIVWFDQLQRQLATQLPVNVLEEVSLSLGKAQISKHTNKTKHLQSFQEVMSAPSERTFVCFPLDVYVKEKDFVVMMQIGSQ